MKIKICFMTMLLPVLNALGQAAVPKYHTLAIGDTVPNIEIKYMFNYPSETARLSDFKGKLLILDFWATWCSPCVAAFPKMDSLRKSFGDKVFILPVTNQDEKTVNYLLINMQKVKGLKGFSVIQDTVLGQLFKHSEIPHYAWINERGIVIAITDGDEVTQSNILKVLNHETLNLKMKADISKVFDDNEPILVGINAMDIDSITNYHILTKHVHGYPTKRDSHPTPGGGWKITALNCSIEKLFELGFSKFQPELIAHKRTILEVKDTVKLMGPDFYGKGKGQGKNEYEAWYEKNTYCYQLIVDHSHIYNAWQEVQDDVTKAFPEYIVVIEKRKSKCLVLVHSVKANLLATKGGSSEKSDNKFFFHLQNAPWQTLPLRLQTYYLQLLDTPIVDETGITGNVDMELTANMSNVSSLRKALQKYGIDIIEAERDINMIVIKDRPVARGSVTNSTDAGHNKIP
jgi:thiol-disulfide isomerase/thioredoxin